MSDSITINPIKVNWKWKVRIGQLRSVETPINPLRTNTDPDTPRPQRISALCIHSPIPLNIDIDEKPVIGSIAGVFYQAGL